MFAMCNTTENTGVWNLGVPTQRALKQLTLSAGHVRSATSKAFQTRSSVRLVLLGASSLLRERLVAQTAFVVDSNPLSERPTARTARLVSTKGSMASRSVTPVSRARGRTRAAQQAPLRALPARRASTRRARTWRRASRVRRARSPTKAV